MKSGIARALLLSALARQIASWALDAALDRGVRPPRAPQIGTLAGGRR